MPIMFTGSKILFTDGGAVAMDENCCCTETPNPCDPYPSIVVSVTGASGSVSWCGVTWNFPGDSGKQYTVCPTQYEKGTSTGGSTVNWRHRWFNGNGIGLELFRRYLSYHGDSTFYTNLNFLNLPGITAKDIFAKSWQTNQSTAVTIDSTFDLGLISGEPLPQKTNYTITNAWFGSYDDGTYTYTWSRGSGW